MAERVLLGAPASPGVGLGSAWTRAEEVTRSGLVAEAERERERDTALVALAAAADALADLAARLPAEEAEIVETGVLMARDPALARAVENAVLREGMAAARALVHATGEHAAAIAAIGDESLAARADDVRSLGRRAALLTTNGRAEPPPGTDLVLVAHDVGPADIAELAPTLAGVALAGGSPTSHASIVARSLGVPMVTGLDPEVLTLAAGTPVAVDGTDGALVVEPSTVRARAAAGEMRARRRAAERATSVRGEPAVTRDGRRVAVLVNVASAEELDVGLGAGAEGIGLLRTELAFLDATGWPTEGDHVEALARILPGLGDRRAVVRVLDFGADKSPPFLTGTAARGIELLLAHPHALEGQLRAIVRASAGGRDVRILLPMVERADQLVATRALLDAAARELVGSGRAPQLGAMIETGAGAANAAAIAAGCEFLSIGTNDLTAALLGVDRFATHTARTHHPVVLRAIARTVEAAHADGKTIEVCGEAASDARVLPLLVGLGVDEVSVGAARVGSVRDWIRRLRADDAERLAQAALVMDTASEVERAVSSLAGRIQSEPGGGCEPAGGGFEPAGGSTSRSAESGNGGREGIESGAGVRAFGA